MKEKSRGATNNKKQGKSLKEKRAAKHAKQAERAARPMTPPPAGG
jgi:hypothetical protein